MGRGEQHCASTRWRHNASRPAETVVPLTVTKRGALVFARKHR